MAATDPQRSFPFPTRTRHMAQGLRDIYQRLLGELDTADRGGTPRVDPVAARKHLEQVADILKFIGAPDVHTLGPKQTRNRRVPLDQGAVVRGIVRLLKRSEDWMSGDQLARGILDGNALEVGPVLLADLVRAVQGSCVQLQRKNIIVPEVSAARGTKQRWQLAGHFFHGTRSA